MELTLICFDVFFRDYLVTKDKKSYFVAVSEEPLRVFSLFRCFVILTLLIIVDLIIRSTLVLLYRECYGFERECFYLQAFFSLHSFPTIYGCTAKPVFIKVSLGVGSLNSVAAGFHAVIWTVYLNHTAIFKLHVQKNVYLTYQIWLL